MAELGATLNTFGILFDANVLLFFTWMEKELSSVNNSNWFIFHLVFNCRYNPH